MSNPFQKPNVRPQDSSGQKMYSQSMEADNVRAMASYFGEEESMDERPFSKLSSTSHMGPHLDKHRPDFDPKLKALGSEISKRMSEVRKLDNELLEPEIVIETQILAEELERCKDKKDNLAKRLEKADKSYNSSLTILTSLIDQIKKHLISDLAFYEKVATRSEKESSHGHSGKAFSEKEWNNIGFEIFTMKKECENILKKIREKQWETPEVQESHDFLEWLQTNRGQINEIGLLKNEDAKNKMVIQKLEEYIKQLEENANNQLNDPKIANKNNVMKVLHLTKDIKNSGVKEAHFIRDLQDAKIQYDDLVSEQEAFRIAAKRESDQQLRKIEELSKVLRDKEDYEGSTEHKLMYLFEENQKLRDRFDAQQEESDSLRIQLNHRKDINSSLLSTGTESSRYLKPKPKHSETILTELDMDWFKNKMAENIDFMMMLKLQAMTIDENITRVERLDSMEKHLVSPNMKRSDNLLTTNLEPSRFSFGEFGSRK